MSCSPCKGSFNISSFFIVALTGRNCLNTFYPGRCPWAMEAIGLSARCWHKQSSKPLGGMFVDTQNTQQKPSDRMPRALPMAQNGSKIHFSVNPFLKRLHYLWFCYIFVATEPVCIPSELQAGHFLSWIRNQELYKSSWPDLKKKDWSLMMRLSPQHI